MTKTLVRKQHPSGGHHDCDDSPDCLACKTFLGPRDGTATERKTAFDRYVAERCEKSPEFKAEYEKAKAELGQATVQKTIEDKLEDRRPKGEREQIVTNLTIAMGSMLRSLRLSLCDHRDAEEILAEVMLKSMENEGVWVSGSVKRPERDDKKPPPRAWRDRGGNRRTQR